MNKPQPHPMQFQLPQHNGTTPPLKPTPPPRKTPPPNVNSSVSSATGNSSNVTSPTIFTTSPTLPPPIAPQSPAIKVSPIASPSASPGVPRRPPPTPQSQQQQLQQQQQNLPPPPPSNINNLPPSNINIPPPIAHFPPPPSNINLPPPPSNINLPPPIANLPPPSITTTPPILSPTMSPTMGSTSPLLNKVSPSGTPKRLSQGGNVFKPVANSATNTSNIPPPITMIGAPLSSVPNLRTLSQPPAFVKSNSLDPKTMSSYQPLINQNNINNSNNNNSSSLNNSNGSSTPLNGSSGSMPPPPAYLLAGNAGKTNVGNQRLSQDLNSMFQNRLTNGLSPPISTPFYDDKVLSSGPKAIELKEKRDREENERKEREKLKDQEKRDKKEQEKKDKEKKKKEEQEKKDKEKKDKEKKKDEEKKKSKNSGLKGSGPVSPPSIFNTSLDLIMEFQRERAEHPNLPYPVFLKVITEGIIQYNGCSTEGIFRVPGTASEVTRMKKQINEFDFTLTSDDPHVLAGLLKLWLRELTCPVIPQDLYYECIKAKSRDEVLRQFNSLPSLNKEVLHYLLQFLKHVANPTNTPKTKMDADNIAMVFAPGLLRCPPTDPNMMFNTQLEKEFIKSLIDYCV